MAVLMPLAFVICPKVGEFWVLSTPLLAKVGVFVKIVRSQAGVQNPAISKRKHVFCIVSWSRKHPRSSQRIASDVPKLTSGWSCKSGRIEPLGNGAGVVDLYR